MILVIADTRRQAAAIATELQHLAPGEWIHLSAEPQHGVKPGMFYEVFLDRNCNHRSALELAERLHECGHVVIES